MLSKELIIRAIVFRKTIAYTCSSHDEIAQLAILVLTSHDSYKTSIDNRLTYIHYNELTRFFLHPNVLS